MKKLVSYLAVLLGTAVTGILVWRKVESDRMRNDLWAEAERISGEQDPAVAGQTDPDSVERV